MAEIPINPARAPATRPRVARDVFVSDPAAFKNEVPFNEAVTIWFAKISNGAVPAPKAIAFTVLTDCDEFGSWLYALKFTASRPKTEQNAGINVVFVNGCFIILFKWTEGSVVLSFNGISAVAETKAAIQMDASTATPLACKF